MNMNTDENLDGNDLPLLDGEKIEWSGRPQKWKKASLAAFGSVAWTLIWLTVPVGVVVLRLELAPTEWTVNWFIFVPAAIWVVAALYRLLIKPFVDASKRARTRYFLTNIRAFVLEARGQNRNIEIVFLDGLGPTSKLTEKSDGSGDVSIGHQLIFQGIRDARPVHQMIMQAIQGADGTFEGERR